MCALKGGRGGVGGKERDRKAPFFLFLSFFLCFCHSLLAFHPQPFVGYVVMNLDGEIDR